MAMLEPRLCILDETDSGLDIDALRTVADGVNALRDPSARHHRDHPLPAAARLHRARPGPCAGRRPDPALRRQGAGARARGRRLCRRARQPSSPSSGRGPEPMALARSAVEPLAGVRRRLRRRAESQLPGPASARLASARPTPASSSRASRPAGPRTGSTPTSPRRPTCRWRWRPGPSSAWTRSRPISLGGHKARRLIFVNGHVVPELSHVQSLPRGVRDHEPGRARCRPTRERVAEVLGRRCRTSARSPRSTAPSPAPAPGSSWTTVPTPRTRCSCCS